MVKPCWRPLVDDDGTRRGRDGSRRGGDTKGRFDGLLWHKDLGHHVDGEFSMAVIQANNLLEDYSQLESGPLSLLDSGPCGTFIGVYDGHGGPETSRFVNQTLFANLKKFASEHKEISANVIKKAFLATEEEFLSVVRQKWHIMPQIASVGTCCLVGVICNGFLYVANAGDSRVVLGREDKAVGAVTAIQLSTEHNANIESVRDELRTLHPNDSRIVVLKHKVWRVKGIIQAQSQRSVPHICFRWFVEHLTNQEAVDIVNSYPRRGIARRLVKAALRVAAKKREMRYSDLKKIERGVRRHFHDDITVVVVFIDQSSNHRPSPRSCAVSIRGGGGGVPCSPK
ncbi:UNVERIFIED_CONTAM: putative protein phosphatase 2C 38 [Sesamum radiatum]|uniref:protein-serine/threonine phosphatase n=1 Tax=Sesamum radiatum TaxID=300843 RepID=A0AAW2LAG0_SESRA